MAYDHSRKIGNRGDLIKHAVLFAALRYRLGQHGQQDQPFAYAETHAGRPEYVLPDGGEWQHGIGAFASIDAERRCAALRDFKEAFLGNRITVGMRYPGSTAIAFRLLRAHGSPFRMSLWETDIGAFDDLVRFFHPWRDHIGCHAQDGYAGVRAADPFSLVLIDPADGPGEALRVVPTTLARLREANSSFIAWVTRSSAAKDPPVEAETSTDLRDAVRVHATCIGVRWYKWGHREPGCWIMVSHDLSDVAWALVQDLSKAMNWCEPERYSP
jgi:23S rRNA A2030 N6-methylase RlmJ